MLSLRTDVGHCWDSFKVSFQCWNTDWHLVNFQNLLALHSFLQFTKIPFVLLKDCWKTNVFKLFSLITLVRYNLSKAILSIFLGYSKLYCKSNYICPQESKYMRILSVIYLIKGSIFFFIAFIEIVTQLFVSLMPFSFTINSTRACGSVYEVPSTVPRDQPIHTCLMNE